MSEITLRVQETYAFLTTHAKVLGDEDKHKKEATEIKLNRAYPHTHANKLHTLTRTHRSARKKTHHASHWK